MHSYTGSWLRFGDSSRETPQGPGTSLGAFRVGNPLEQIVPISDNAPKPAAGLLTEVVNDKGRYHSQRF
jgi:hypothetical protein